MDNEKKQDSTELLIAIRRIEDIIYALATDMEGKRIIETKHVHDILHKLYQEGMANL